ncbi:uncharacterized protein Z518_07367 [Rhinocladiella mackenziei CBS 650.93]|uniref:Metallo-beta-lactamase domain-containing protein n=1 Tax=Rhinocladiella mackenziei CBS 650.93 TaxID=1442369 RepID=A0A0D2IDA6_9EURO|nr:uncharacterized protein Z518_07367 [Rhinocladiella mackenziei CBS 650.93]KIX03814.1 hypothetical protein Z518_07367 [Rhinocladiella mackenziei CBS 650.93]
MASKIKRFQVPAGATAQVSIIDSTTKINKIRAEYLMGPAMSGLEYMPEIPTWSFLVESATGRKALYDLGVPPNWKEFAPTVVETLHKRGWEIEAEIHVVDILKENRVDPTDINAIVWSHWHWDHLGDPSTFPPNTELVVGPGFKEAFFPGWPAKPDSPVRESDFIGRSVREVEFGQDSIQIGQFKAIDFFGDGSFYLLDTPGHAIGHLGGLARTTSNPDTFMFFGGDLCHHGGEIRPSPYLPLPKQIDLHFPGLSRMSCPGADLEALQTSRARKIDEPFFDPAMGLSIEEAIRTIKKTQEADGDDDVLFIYAHDSSVRRVADLFPLKANDWKAKGWREKMLWDFLNDFREAMSRYPK